MKLIRFCIVITISFVLFTGCNNANSRYLRRIQKMEEGISNPSTIDELKEAIAKYRQRVEDIINAQTQVGVWYKMLAIRYLDNSMYGEAIDTLEKAIKYYPANPNLYYYLGVSAGYMAKASLDYKAVGNTSEKERYYKLSESAYLRGIELNPKYIRALYGLGILYTYELKEPEKAISYLETALSVETKNTEIMMVLATAHYLNQNYQRSVELFDRVISLTKSEEKKREAENNKKTVLDAMHE